MNRRFSGSPPRAIVAEIGANTPLANPEVIGKIRVQVAQR